MRARWIILTGFGLLTLSGCLSDGAVEIDSDTYVSDSNDSQSSSDTNDTCLAPGRGEDGASVECCGGFGCCGAGPCCGAEACDTGGWCTVDEDCGPGQICDTGTCIVLPADAIVECPEVPPLSDATFGAGVNIGPSALAAIDFTGDGLDDLLIASAVGVAVWESRGDSTFDEVLTMDPQVGSPKDMVVLDADGDEALDILVLGEGSPGHLGHLRPDALDMWFPEPVMTAGAAPVRMEAGDLNGDGFVDLVLMSSNLPDLNVVHVLLADGVGGFLIPMDVTLSQPPLDIRLASVTPDDKLDLVVGHVAGVTVLAGRGTGGFDVAAELTSSSVATAGGVAVADLGGSSEVEIVLAAEVNGSGRLSIWSWAGTATSPTPLHDYAVGPGLTHVLVDDIGGDGVLDLVVATGAPTGAQPLPGEVLIMPITGDGAVACQAVFGLAKSAVRMITGDFNDDGHRDIATASGVDTLTLLLSDPG